MAQPFHAGGAVSTFRLHDPSIQGIYRVATAYFPSLAHLDFTRLGSLIAIAGVIPAVWRVLRSAWHETYNWVRQFFVASVVIPGRDPLNKNVINWVLDRVIRPRRNTRFFTARTEVRDRIGRGDVSESASLKKTQRQIQYLPHFESVWFWHNGRLFLIHRSLESFNTSMCDPGYDGIGGEELQISCPGRSAEPIRSLIQTCRDYADQQTQYFVMIYSRDRYGISWQPKSRKPIRLLETVHFDLDAKQELLADIRKYLDPETQKRYQSRSMPYRRGYLFYGPPGTGKSSLSTALAGEFGLDLYEVKIPSVGSDADLEQMFQEIPPQCIVLLEDIDAVWTADRELSEHEDRTIASNGSRSPRSNCTLSGLLNVLDGVGSQEGRIVIMTTNKPEMLDPALVRPGRVDMKVHLGNISRKLAAEMFLRMFSDSSENDIGQLAIEFAEHIPENKFTPSQLQGFFQMHLDSAADAVESVAMWVAKELSRSIMDDDIEIVGQVRA
ncbi:putative mitochondrial chaperone BCS1-B [Cytospora mali]|nr:putative mitochondrial chaperone BCS1-B [Valsa mali]